MKIKLLKRSDSFTSNLFYGIGDVIVDILLFPFKILGKCLEVLLD